MTGGQLFESNSRSPPNPEKETAATASSIRLMVKGQIKPDAGAVRSLNNIGASKRLTNQSLKLPAQQNVRED